MNPLRSLLPLFVLTLSLHAAGDVELVKSKGTLLFQDEFDRPDDPMKDNVGNGWKTNSQGHAGGKKQATMQDGVLTIVRLPEADHGVGVTHEAAFQDGAVELKFRLQKKSEAVGVHFFDHDLETVHAGHLCKADIALGEVSLADSKTGAQNLKVQEQRLKGDQSPEFLAFLSSKEKAFPLALKPGEWHQLLVVIEGDAMRATVDGQAVGEFKSEGIAHPTKKSIELAVNKGAQVDSIQIWKLK